jgi:O-acetyl-ADP-ribose deacetylase (regulator of RNase III)
MKNLSLLILAFTFSSTSIAGWWKSHIFQNGDAMLSTYNTESPLAGPESQLAPRGSAAITDSGELKVTGIDYIIHAATGSMSGAAEGGEPTKDSLILSLTNGLHLAKIKKVNRVAIPLIGGGIFLERMGLSKLELAEIIITTALQSQSKIDYVFVAYGEEDFSVMSKAYTNVKKKFESTSLGQKVWNYTLGALKNARKERFFAHSEVVQGSITDFQLHGADAIFNAANMELQFGGGISGFIGKATGSAQEIDAICAELIKSYWQN